MKLQFIVSNQTNPYWNIAVEQYLVDIPIQAIKQSDNQTITLYLWKNRRTVVIGQNQNPYSEVNLEALEADGGFLMRRKTGGGAVYHDDGNINFSFVVPKALYDQSRQFAVIQRAVADFGIVAELSGRNDILTEGRKFSGNAFSKGKYQDLHHGTLLIEGNMEDLQRYLCFFELYIFRPLMSHCLGDAFKGLGPCPLVVSDTMASAFPARETCAIRWQPRRELVHDLCRFEKWQSFQP